MSNLLNVSNKALWDSFKDEAKSVDEMLSFARNGQLFINLGDTHRHISKHEEGFVMLEAYMRYRCLIIRSPRESHELRN